MPYILAIPSSLLNFFFFFFFSPPVLLNYLQLSIFNITSAAHISIRIIPDHISVAPSLILFGGIRWHSCTVRETSVCEQLASYSAATSKPGFVK
jgi:hypothetical protein